MLARVRVCVRSESTELNKSFPTLSSMFYTTYMRFVPIHGAVHLPTFKSHIIAPRGLRLLECLPFVLYSLAIRGRGKAMLLSSGITHFREIVTRLAIGRK